MGRSFAPISFAGLELGEIRHVCAFFNGDEEKYRVLLPFIKDGFECNDRAVHVVDPDQRSDHMSRLAAAGIDPATAQQNGQLELRTNTETYLRDGRFDQDRMLETFEQMASAPKEGFRLDRIVCHMDWASDTPRHLHDLVEFESRVNHVWSRHDDAIICVYDLAKFGADTVVEMIRTHPLVILGGTLRQNPFFVPPEQFLRERRERQEGRPASGTAT
jgi:hypothetical protein